MTDWIPSTETSQLLSPLLASLSPGPVQGSETATVELRANGVELDTSQSGWVEPEWVATNAKALRAVFDALDREARAWMGVTASPWLQALPYRGISSSIMRITLYGGASVSPQHTDCSIITLLFCRGPGLQIKDEGGEWKDAPATCVLRGTDYAFFGVATPTLHRVEARGPRSSLAFFLRPDPSVFGARSFEDKAAVQLASSSSDWASLPLCVLATLFSFVEAKDVASCAATCRGWHRATLSPYLWRLLCLRGGLTVPATMDYQAAFKNSFFPTIQSAVFVKVVGISKSPSGTSNCKIVVVGDSFVGKSALMSVWAHSAEMNASITVQVDDKHNVQLGLWDTAGGADYDRLRPLSYPPTDLFIFCFSLASRPSFQRVADMWLPEVNHHIPNCRRILLGTQADRRWQVAGDETVTTDQAIAFASKNHFLAYFETSATRLRGVRDPLDFAARCVVSQVLPLDDPENQQAGKKKCAVQ
jgi:small GTP-binding protein